MTLQTLLNRPLTIITRSDSATLDDYGDPVKTDAEIETFGEMQPRSAIEPQGDFSSEDWVAFFSPADQDSLNSASAVRDEELGRFEIIGMPAAWRNPHTRTNQYIRADLRRTAGPSDTVAS